MPCPFHRDQDRGIDRGESGDGVSSNQSPWWERSGVSRRSFLKSALVIGGTSALSACVKREGPVDPPAGTSDPLSLPERQFEWNDYLPTGAHGNVLIPNHQLMLFLDYEDSGTPTSDDREQIESALRSLERAYQWGTGDEFNPTSTTGLLFMIGYSQSYFDRFKQELPSTIDLPSSKALINELEEEADADEFDAVLILTSDIVQVLLEAEQALIGNFDEVNETSIDASLKGVFEVADRRTGFIGVGRPADELDVDGVSENSPTAMGFRSGFKDNQATESRVSILDGPFSDGSTMQVSQLVFDLESWYDLSEERRIELMFSPDHDPEDVGEIGEKLAGQSRLTEEMATSGEENARGHGTIGHTQKVAAARDDDFEPTILRRSEGVSTDLDRPGMNFLSVQREMKDFVEIRKAMNGEHIDTEVTKEDDGILDYIDVLRRATYLVPPRSLRSLPTPQPEQT